ncbi:MAG: DUF2911 domain-containing protein [Ferruginibacter sp.]
MAMLLKTRLPIALFAIITVLFSGCTQKEDNPGGRTKVMRIPVSVKDSLLLSVDKSPMDMIYFPEDYPKEKMVTPGMDNPLARLIYSRPQKNGRIIFADSSVTENVIQYYGQDWRLGANEATEIEFFKPVTISGKKIDAGRYIIYCIPYPDKWKIIINGNLFSWGLHIDKTKDIAEVEIPVIKNNVQIEYFTMLFQRSANGCELVMAWGDIKAVLPINIK